MALTADQRIKMKVQWIGNAYRSCTWPLLLISGFCLLMQSHSLAMAAAVPTTTGDVESEIFSSGGNDAFTSINQQSVWPPMKHHDIWNDVTVNADEEVPPDENDIDTAKETIKDFVGNDFQFLVNTNNNNKSSNALEESASKESNSWNNASLDSLIGVQRQSKVFRIFSVPVDGECLSDDGRRTGTCLNIYQCRQKGGTAKGDCAMGFGVCCVFVVNCNQTVSNNITYLVSPQFPSFMPNNFTSCAIKVKLMSEDISQLRMDFYHFSLGQPNRRTGVCDGDVFNVSGGPGGTFSLCGQNSGQHIYYDVGGRFLPRQTLYGSIRPPTLSQLYPNQNTSDATEQLIEISMNFAQRFLPIRLWEIRIAQIPFSQRAPAGCLQYHFGTEGVIQTFNFADNGRHLANQHYRVCMRQETEMCSIMYQPCDEQSFRIGPSRPMRGFPQQPLASTGGGSPAAGMPAMMGGPIPLSGPGAMPTNLMMGIMTPAGASGGMGVVMPGSVSQASMPATSVLNTMDPSAAVTTAPAQMPTTPVNVMRSSTAAPTAAESMTTAASMPVAASMDTSAMTSASSAASTTAATTTAAPTTRASMAPASMTTEAMQMMESSTVPTTTAPTTTPSTTAASPSSTQRTTTTTTPSTTTSTTTTTTSTPTTSSTTTATLLSDNVEGSGDDEPSADPGKFVPTRRPRPASGGFDLLGFLRSAFELRLGRSAQKSRRQQRQIYSTCSDRITLPCIVEDFIGTGLGPFPSCEPVHCGTQFCSSGTWPCRVESTVTPFFLNIHFGNGIGKGSAEDNIGACLRYTQVQCM